MLLKRVYTFFFHSVRAGLKVKLQLLKHLLITDH
jgi:hypothetical protein